MTAPAKRSTPRAPTAATAKVVPLIPRLRAKWAGGIYAGRLGTYLLICGPLLVRPLDWSAAGRWAADLDIGGRGYRGWSLPTCAELAHLDATFPKLFRREPYWSCEEQVDLPTDALVVHFGASGLVSHWGKRHSCCAVSVRRILA